MKPSLLLCGALLLLLFPWASSGNAGPENTLKVPQDFPTIQAAVNAAPEGATVVVAPGTYIENITMAKSLTLQGSGRENTILEPVPGFGDSFRENPLITLRVPSGREAVLQLRQLTLRDPQATPQPTLAFGQVIGLNIDSPKNVRNVRVVIEQTNWIGFWYVVRATSLQRLETRDSTFQQNGFVFYSLATLGLDVEEAVIERSRFIENSGLLVGGIALQGKHLQVVDNTIMSKPGHSYNGISLALLEGGRAEVVRNSVSLNNSGLYIALSDRTSALIQGNQFFANSYNMTVNPFYLSTPQIDVLIEENIIVGGGIGVDINYKNVTGKIRLHKNQIAWQRRQSLTGDLAGFIWSLPYCPGTPFCMFEPAKGPLFAQGILLSGNSPDDQKSVKPLKLELSENRIEANEGWGLALFGRFEGDSFSCIVLGEQLNTVLPEITGKDNEFKDNAKGAICPNAYPLPPGFMK